MRGRTNEDANPFAAASVSQEYTDLLDRNIYKDISNRLVPKIAEWASFFHIPSSLGVT